MVVAVRAVVYAAVFAGVVLIFVPARVLSWSGITRPAVVGAPQLAGMVVGAVGATLVAWCVTTFAFVGRGTPAPFDPPRRLVIRGPYGFVRNPMYIGGGLALAGAAIFYQSTVLLGYTALLFVAAQLFCRLLRGANPEADLRRGVRGLLPERAALVAEGMGPRP